MGQGQADGRESLGRAAGRLSSQFKGWKTMKRDRTTLIAALATAGICLALLSLAAVLSHSYAAQMALPGVPAAGPATNAVEDIRPREPNFYDTPDPYDPAAIQRDPD